MWRSAGDALVAAASGAEAAVAAAEARRCGVWLVENTASSFFTRPDITADGAALSQDEGVEGGLKSETDMKHMSTKHRKRCGSST
jgi:hypothetical protein